MFELMQTFNSESYWKQYENVINDTIKATKKVIEDERSKEGGLEFNVKNELGSIDI